MKTITITQKDLEKAKIQFSDSGYIIDELAYSVGWWTSNDMNDNNLDYAPDEPYCYNYEADLFEATKTSAELYNIARTLNVSLNANWERIANEQKLQCGACVALNNNEQWDELLKAYKAKLQEDRVDGISKAYNMALEKEIDSYLDDCYKEWLHGDRSTRGVIYEISKYYTQNGSGEYDQKAHEYTFYLDEGTIADYKDNGYKISEFKKAILIDIYNASDARKHKETKEREARKAERERLALYKKEQAEKAQAEREIKLKAMTI